MRQFLSRILSYMRRNVIAFVALFFALGAGGGYAIAATSNKAIHGCVNSRTHAVYIQKRCHGGQTPLVWNQEGSPSPTAWASVLADGFTAGGHGIAINHVSTGTYNVTATASQCTDASPGPTVTINGNPPTGLPAGGFPVAWETFNRSKFTVYTGVVVDGSFTPTDEAFNVQVPCS